MLTKITVELIFTASEWEQHRSEIVKRLEPVVELEVDTRQKITVNVKRVNIGTLGDLQAANGGAL